jgi:SAM-dependent methyltransferase
MCVSPPLSPAALDTFYDDTFANDPASVQRVGSGFPEQKDLWKEENLAENWGLKIIQRFMEVRGKSILDLRCRSGALSAILKAQGAEVLGVEPFEANINYARERRKLSDVVVLPFSRFDQFPDPPHGAFDAVNVLAHHVLAHVLSPRVLLAKIFEVLKPGGYIFLDEKDVLRPARHKKKSVMDSGPAHQYHLTLHTTARYFHSAGFELIEYEIDKYRTSDFRHIRIIGRRPETVRVSPQWKDEGPTVEKIQSRLCWLERTWPIRHASIITNRKVRKLLRRIGM